MVGRRLGLVASVLCEIACARPNPQFSEGQGGRGTSTGKPGQTAAVDVSTGVATTRGEDSGGTTLGLDTAADTHASTGTTGGTTTGDVVPVDGDLLIFEGGIGNGAAVEQFDGCEAAAGDLVDVVCLSGFIQPLVAGGQTALQAIEDLGGEEPRPVIGPLGSIMGSHLDLVDTAIGPAADFEAAGVFTTFETHFWSGIDANGAAAEDCDAWAGIGEDGRVGDGNGFAEPWWSEMALRACDTPYPILCICIAPP